MTGVRAGPHDKSQSASKLPAANRRVSSYRSANIVDGPSSDSRVHYAASSGAVIYAPRSYAYATSTRLKSSAKYRYYIAGNIAIETDIMMYKDNMALSRYSDRCRSKLESRHIHNVRLDSRFLLIARFFSIFELSRAREPHDEKVRARARALRSTATGGRIKIRTIGIRDQRSAP